MASISLTDRYIRAIAPRQNQRLEIWDEREKGLVLRVTPAGVKSFAFRYKAPDAFDGAGRRLRRRLTLGEYRENPMDAGKLSLAEARERTRAAKGDVARGGDPAIEKASARDRGLAAARRAYAATLSEAIERFVEIDRDTSSKWRRKERPRILRRELAKHFSRGVGVVSADDLRAIQKSILNRGAPFAANRFSEAVRGFWKWAALTYQIENIALSLGAVADERERRRTRFLTISELQKVWNVAEKLSPVARDFVRALMITPQRASAVARMQWAQLDEDHCWRIPIEQKKGKAGEQLIPLSEAMIELLEKRSKSSVDSGYVFSSDPEGLTYFQAYSKAKATLDAELGPSFAAWRFHDLRRSFRTWCAEAGVDQAVARKILDHGQSSRDELERIYQQYQYLDEQRATLNAYAAHVRG